LLTTDEICIDTFAYIMTNRTGTVLLLLVSSLSIYGQQHLVIKGKISDEYNNPLSSVTIRVLKNGTGTVSNQSGLFSLNVSQVSSTDTVVFSSIGYSSKKTAISDFLVNQINLIQLTGKSELLQEVVVKSTDPLVIIQSAIEKIPVNYYNSIHESHGFYRLNAKKGEEYLMLSEAVFDIQNFGYSSGKDNQFKLIKSRYVQDEKGIHGIDLAVKPKGLYSSDIIKSVEESEVLNKGALKKHKYKFLKSIKYNGADTYVIGFDQKDDVKESLYSGKCYIDKESRAIVAIEYSRSAKGIEYAKYGDAATRTLLKMMGLNIDIKGEHHFITYQKVNGKWFLSSVKSTYSWNFKSNARFYDFPANIRLDYVVTGVDTINIQPYTGKETLGDNKVIEFQNKGVQLDFWKDYNIILPDYNTDSIANKILAKNESFNLKKKVEKKLRAFPKDKALRIDSILNFYHQNGAFNGTVLIKKEGKILLVKGYGLADKEKGIAAADITQYRTGSLTKTFTSLLILQLVAENKLSLQDSVGKYLPSFVHKSVTIHQLLTHTSGMPSYTNDVEKMVSIMSNRQSLNDIIITLCSDTLEFEKGTSFRYSNSGYTVLAGIIEVVTGKTYSEVLHDKIFAPAAMDKTTFGANDLNSKGYWMGSAEPSYIISNTAGAGGISSTVLDLLKWDEVLRTDKLISQSLLSEAFLPRSSYDDWDADYGFGWMIDRKMFQQSKRHKIIYHPGTDFGYYSMFVRQPDTDNLIIMLSNTGDFPRFDLTDLILDEIN
jgi:CubicO group peptidase (beta-lactamase class C family)